MVCILYPDGVGADPLLGFLSFSLYVFRINIRSRCLVAQYRSLSTY